VSIFRRRKSIRTSGKKRAVRRHVLEPSEFRKTIYFRNALKERGIDADIFVSKSDEDREFTLRNGVKIYFSSQDDIATLLANFDAAFETDNLSKEEVIKTNTTLEYIDLRFNNRVFFNHKEQQEL